jgi:hypothetical protein
MKLDFETWSGYRVWRVIWRAQYEALSYDILLTKGLRRQVDDLHRPGTQSRVEYLKVRARKMLEEREDAKVRAARLMGRPRTYRHGWVFDTKHQQWVWAYAELPIESAQAVAA